jgi:hypothetical protein
VHAGVHARMCAFMSVHLRTCTRVLRANANRMWARVHACARACVCVCVCARVCVCVLPPARKQL